MEKCDKCGKEFDTSQKLLEDTHRNYRLRYVIHFYVDGLVSYSKKDGKIVECKECYG